MYLRDKVVMITGASRGIGRAAALEFAAQGADVVVGARCKEELDTLVAEIRTKYKARTIAMMCDVSRKADVDTFATRTVEEFGRIDVLVNNAGMGIYGDVAEITEEDFEMMVNINFKGVFLATKTVLPVLMKQKSGHIITVSSVAGKRPIPKMAVYSGTKFALDGFCKSLAKEVKPYNIRVSLIYPGMVDTHFRDKMINRPAYSAEERSRMLTAQDIARAIVFIASQSPTAMVDELEITAPMF